MSLRQLLMDRAVTHVVDERGSPRLSPSGRGAGSSRSLTMQSPPVSWADLYHTTEGVSAEKCRQRNRPHAADEEGYYFW